MVIVAFLDGMLINSLHKLEPIVFQSSMVQIPYFHIILPIYKSLDELFEWIHLDKLVPKPLLGMRRMPSIKWTNVIMFINQKIYLTPPLTIMVDFNYLNSNICYWCYVHMFNIYKTWNLWFSKCSNYIFELLKMNFQYVQNPMASLVIPIVFPTIIVTLPTIILAFFTIFVVLALSMSCLSSPTISHHHPN